MSDVLDMAEYTLHHLAHHDPDADCLKDCPFCEANDDQEGVRQEGDQQDG